MDNQHRKITGYRELSQSEIDLINRIKKLGEEIGDLVMDINQHILDQRSDPSAHTRHAVAMPFTWLESGTHDIQVGLMEITRSVAQPTSF